MMRWIPERKITINSRIAIPLLAAVGILLIASYVRINTFWLPHWRGDQNHYVTLAMKLDSGGLDHYNLREVRVHQAKHPYDRSVELVFPRHDLPGKVGDIILMLGAVGQSYYNEPLHMRAPLFPYLLMFSHAVFSGKNQPFVVVTSNLGREAAKIRPRVVFHAQFWAVIVPFFFNLCLVFLTFLIGWRFFNARAGIYASFLMATNAVSVFSAHRLLAEDTTAFFAVLSLFLYLLFYRKKNLIGVFAAGAAAGLAILSKQTAGLILFVVWFYTYLAANEKKWNFQSVTKTLTNIYLLVYTAATFLVSAFWFIRVMQTYGHPLHVPSSGMTEAVGQDVTGWFQAIAQRPHPVLFFTLSVVLICPLFGLAFFALRDFFRSLGHLAATDDKARHATVLFWFLIFAFYLYYCKPWAILLELRVQEHRYFYTAYPAIAVFAGVVLDRLRHKMTGWIRRPWMAECLIAVLLAANGWYSAPIGLRVAFLDYMLL